MKVVNESFTFSTRGEIDFVDLTNRLEEVVGRSGIKNGLAHIFAPHATGILIITEHEPGMDNDIRDLLEKLIPSQHQFLLERAKDPNQITLEPVHGFFVERRMVRSYFAPN